MKIFIGYCILCIFFIIKVQSNPQITKLFPVKEIVEFHEKTNEIKPLDKFLGKLRATYNFVFNKEEDTSNVEKILSNDVPNPDLETLKLLLANVINPLPVDKSEENNESNVNEERKLENSNENKNEILSGDKNESEIDENAEKDDWLNGIEAPKPMGELELQNDSDDDSVVETTTPKTFQLPIDLGRRLLQWLGSLLGLTYGAYTRVSQAIKT